MQHDMQVIRGNKEEGDSDHSQERMARVLMRIRNLMCKHRSHGTHCSTRPHVLHPRIRPRLPLPLHSQNPSSPPLPPSLPSFLLSPRKPFSQHPKARFSFSRTLLKTNYKLRSSATKTTMAGCCCPGPWTYLL